MVLRRNFYCSSTLLEFKNLKCLRSSYVNNVLVFTNFVDKKRDFADTKLLVSFELSKFQP